MQCPAFFQQKDSNDRSKNVSTKYRSSSSNRCVFEVDFEYPKEPCELHNDYPFAPDKIEIKKEMLSSYQLKIADR